MSLTRSFSRQLIAICLCAYTAQAIGQDFLADRAARRCLRLFAKGNIQQLVVASRGADSFELRLFSSYLLYKRSPLTYRKDFLRALPTDSKDFERFSRIPSNLRADLHAETYKVSAKNVPWPISFWEIHTEIVNLALAGHRQAILCVLGLSKYGDGEIGEGMGEAAWRLFEHPEFIASHWDIFNSRADDLGAVKSEMTPKEIEALRTRYVHAFAKNQSGLKVILDAFEHAER